MSSFELSEKNYRRIALINWLLSIPLLLIFAWPYFFLSELIHIHQAIAFPGSIIFALPFMLTLLHGHVTLALGAVHRHHYYNWLQQYPFTFGVLFHPIVVSTRFRLTLFFASLVILAFGLWVN